jgi:hypothetical protein
MRTKKTSSILLVLAKTGCLFAATSTRQIDPVSREMILNNIAMHSLGLAKSYCAVAARSIVAPAPAHAARNPRLRWFRAVREVSCE